MSAVNPELRTQNSELTVLNGMHLKNFFFRDASMMIGDPL
jgi:hypothetical protein